jgi:hypothetical protein
MGSSEGRQTPLGVGVRKQPHPIAVSTILGNVSAISVFLTVSNHAFGISSGSFPTSQSAIASEDLRLR